MRVARVRIGAETVYGILEEDDQVALLSSDPFSGVERSGERRPLNEVALEAPTVPTKILAVGKNYADHIREMGNPWPHEPSIFLKPPSAVIGPGESIRLPRPDVSKQVQYEAELAVVIGRRCRDVDEGEAAKVIFGITGANDVSARDLQKSDFHVTRAKGHDTFCPLGPWIETDHDPWNELRVQCLVNGELRQNGVVRDLVFDVPFIVSYLSRFCTLMPGDVILTGSPGGSGDLNAGDEVTVRVSGIGDLRNVVISS